MSDEALLERPDETQDVLETQAEDVSSEAAAPLFCSPILDRIRTSD